MLRETESSKEFRNKILNDVENNYIIHNINDNILLENENGFCLKHLECSSYWWLFDELFLPDIIKINNDTRPYVQKLYELQEEKNKLMLDYENYDLYSMTGCLGRSIPFYDEHGTLLYRTLGKMNSIKKTEIPNINKEINNISEILNLLLI